MRYSPTRIRAIGADVGGTFTDVILIDSEGHILTHKVPSTPPDFEQAVLNAIEHLLHTADASGTSVTKVAHGTTVATNAVLEHRGAKTALITTKGGRSRTSAHSRPSDVQPVL